MAGIAVWQDPVQIASTPLASLRECLNHSRAA